MGVPKLQAKDLPDEIVLKAIAGLQLIPRVYRTAGHIAHFTPLGAVGWDLHKLWDNIPEKVINAKLKKLVDRGLLDGCACGCRGDFTVTDKGRELMEESDGRV